MISRLEGDPSKLGCFPAPRHGTGTRSSSLSHGYEYSIVIVAFRQSSSHRPSFLSYISLSVFLGNFINLNSPLEILKGKSRQGTGIIGSRSVVLKEAIRALREACRWKAMEWLGHAKTTFTHSPKPLHLQKKDGSSTDLLKICQEACRLNPLLFNGHLQTMWTVLKTDGPPIHYKRKIFEAEDAAYEGSFAVDFVVKPFSETDDSLPIRTTYFKDEEFESIASLDNRPMLVGILHYFVLTSRHTL